MLKVRFHLGRGEHYKHWQVRGSKGLVEYYDPEQYVLDMYGCKLVSNNRVAQQVNASGVKDVCGWISCRSIHISGPYEGLDNLVRVWYNPIVDTEWHMQGVDSSVTGHEFHYLTTRGRRVYSCKF